MDFKSFTEKTDLCSKTEVEKIRLIAFYLALFENTNEFNLKTTLSMLEAVGCKVSNISRLKNNLRDDRNFKRNCKTDNWILNPKIIKELKIQYQEDERYTREGDDLIGTIIFDQKDSGKIATLPYPADIDDLPPVHIREGRFVFKHFGFLNLDTGKKGDYILN